MAKQLDQKLITDCAKNLGLTVSEVLSIAATAPRRYYVWEIGKRSGGMRTVCHPSVELKAIQEYFLHHVLHLLPVHASATAYVKGGSIKRNAQAHVLSRVSLKLDFTDFFPSLKVDNWISYVADHFPSWSNEEVTFSSRILFWGEGSYSPKCLAIGSPTSPLISNALLFDVDARLSKYAAPRGLVYTRYADDITFSSKEKLEYKRVVRVVRDTLAHAKYSTVKINSTKTVLVSKKHSRRVTGLIITPDNKVSLGRARKRSISAMVHWQCSNKLGPADRDRLRGFLAFALDVEPTFVMMLRRKYGSENIDAIMKWGSGLGA